MGGKIPDHTDVVLEKTEIDARRIEVIQRSQRPVVDQLTNLPDGAAKQERVVHHDLEVLPRGQLDQRFRLCRGGRKRLFNEYVFSVLQGRLCNSKCVQTGVTTATASISGEFSTSEMSVVRGHPGRAGLRA